MPQGILNVVIESKTSHRNNQSSQGYVMSYLDTASFTNTAMPIMAICESTGSEPEICHSILTDVRKIFLSDFFTSTPQREHTNEAESMHSKIMTLFIEVNSTLNKKKKQKNFSEASLCVGILIRDTMYFGISGNLNTLLLRDTVLYNLNLNDDVFEHIKGNPYKTSKKQLLGTTVIPQVNTYKLKINSGDCVFLATSACNENIEDSELVELLYSSPDSEKSSSFLKLVSEKNPNRKLAIAALLATGETEPPSSKNQDERLIAELSPEYPPSFYEDTIQFKRSSDDFYNTTNLASKKEASKLSELEVQKNYPIREWGLGKKIALFFLSLILTIVIGSLWLLKTGAFQSGFESNWSIDSTIPLKSVKIQNKEEFLKNGYLSFSQNSAVLNEVLISPADNLYNCSVIINSSKPIEVQSFQSPDFLKQNTLTLEKEKLFLATNMISLTDIIKISSENTGSSGKYYITHINIRKIKNPIMIKNISMKSLREIEIKIGKNIDK